LVTEPQRKFIIFLVKWKIWKAVFNMRLISIRPRWGTRWLLKKIKGCQVVDNLHHAPCCPANHYHRTRLVFKRCSCGAEFEFKNAWDAAEYGALSFGSSFMVNRKEAIEAGKGEGEK